jgi:RNA polymerase sigma factor (sigma-70 family)
VPRHTATRRPDINADLQYCLGVFLAASEPAFAAQRFNTQSGQAVRSHGGGVGVDLQSILRRAVGTRTLVAFSIGFSSTGSSTATSSSESRDGAELHALEEVAVARGIDTDAVRWSLIAIESTHHIGLVQHQANKLARNYAAYTAEDLFGWGWIGLRAALRSYDPSRFAFSTYACTRIVGAIRDGVRAEQPIPKRLGAELRKLDQVRDHLADELLRAPTLAELHHAAGLAPDRAALLDRCRPASSLDELCAGVERAWTPSALGVDGGIEDGVETSARRAAIVAALKKLDPEDAEAVRILILEDTPVAEAEALTGATSRQLRQRKARGLAALAPMLTGWSTT